MNESELRVFIEGATLYFNQVSEEPVEVGTPYLCERERCAASDYTGIIGISGVRQGSVYFTAPRVLLRHLLLSLGEPNTGAEHIADLVGEVANTISGNARRGFGPEFMVSVPVVCQGAPEQFKLPDGARPVVIPLAWRSYRASLVINLQ